jgi:hypothetical protein
MQYANEKTINPIDENVNMIKQCGAIIQWNENNPENKINSENQMSPKRDEQKSWWTSYMLEQEKHWD